MWIALLATIFIILTSIFSFSISKISAKNYIYINDLVSHKEGRVTDDFERDINNLIRNHHEQALKQSAVQFWFSLTASIIGFVFIILIIILPGSSKWYEDSIKLIPGIIIEVVSALFFSQSKQARERSSDFLNKLREDRQYAKSITLIDSIEDEKLRSETRAKVALHMSGIKEIDQQLKR